MQEDVEKLGDQVHIAPYLGIYYLPVKVKKEKLSDPRVRHALVCVFLGPRLTTGWSLDLRTASLTGSELRIRARETAPRTETQEETTYPADCGLLSRAGLPVGELRVWADDTVTDEFIADTVIDVPPA